MYQRSCYIIRFNIYGEPEEPRQLSFSLKGTSLTMNTVLPTMKPHTIMLKMLYRKEKDVTYYLAWDIVRDMEVESFESEDIENLLMLGQNGDFGYIVNSRNEVISLDRSITFTMFNINIKGKFPMYAVNFLMNSQRSTLSSATRSISATV